MASSASTSRRIRNDDECSIAIRDRARSSTVTRLCPASRGVVRPSNSTSIAQVANSASGSASSAATWRRSLSGSQRSSSSQNATSSVSSARTPVLRAPASPPARQFVSTSTGTSSVLASEKSGSVWS